MLIEKGARVDGKASGGRNALFTAAKGADMESIKFLVDKHGLDPTHKDGKDETPGYEVTQPSFFFS